MFKSSRFSFFEVSLKLMPFLALLGNFFYPSTSLTLIYCLILATEQRATFKTQALFLSYSHYLSSVNLITVVMECSLWLFIFLIPIKEESSDSTKALLLIFNLFMLTVLKVIFEKTQFVSLALNLVAFLFFYSLQLIQSQKNRFALVL